MTRKIILILISIGQSIVIFAQCGYTINTNTINATCPGGTGIATAQVSGGTTPYSYLWSDGAGQTIANATLAAGIYTVTITDQTACDSIIPFTITEPQPLNVTGTITNEICNNGAGAINIVVTGATTPYTFNWNNGVITQNNLNIPSGNYSLAITDNNNCNFLQAYSTVVDKSTNKIIANPIATPTTCNRNDGSIAVSSVSGGTNPYTYSLNGQIATNAVFSNLTPNTYSIEIKDNNGCVKDTSIVVPEPPILISAAKVTQPICGSENGSIAVISSGKAPINYELNGAINTNGVFTKQSPGSYIVNITDADNCTDTVIANVSRVCIEYIPPDAFSPNGDGLEDNWLIPELSLNFPNCNVLVYDRFGQKVFDQTGYLAPWDGGGVESAAYFYVIYNEKFNKKAGITTGSVSILR